ncbi:MAG: hypothetical protein ACXVFO_09650 [Solirubrobacteraceae bacterium]
MRLFAPKSSAKAKTGLGLPPDPDETTSPVKLPAGQELPPLGSAQFAGPVAAYKTYAERQLATLERLAGEPMVDYITPFGGGYFFAPRGAAEDSDWVGSGLFRG